MFNYDCQGRGVGGESEPARLSKLGNGARPQQRGGIPVTTPGAGGGSDSGGDFGASETEGIGYLGLMAMNHNEFHSTLARAECCG